MPRTILNDLPWSAVAKISMRAAEAQWPDVIPMAGGEPIFAPPQDALDGLHTASIPQLTRYTAFKGSADLLDLVRIKLSRVNGIILPTESIICLPGASAALAAVLSVLVDPGDEVLIQDPCWEHYPFLVRLSGGHPVRFRMVQNGTHYEPDVDHLIYNISQRTKVLLINTPLNPCGSVLTKDEILRLLDCAAKNGLTVVADEEYETFVFDGRSHLSPAASNPECVTVHSFSKTFALTGIRLASVAGPRQTIEQLTKFALYTHICPPAPSQRLAVGALAGDYVAHMRAVGRLYEQQRDLFVSELLSVNGLEVHKPEGGVYVFPHLPATVAPAADFLMNSCHILCIPGESSGEQGRGRVRLFFGLDAEQLHEASARMRVALGTAKVAMASHVAP